MEVHLCQHESAAQTDEVGLPPRKFQRHPRKRDSPVGRFIHGHEHAGQLLSDCCFCPPLLPLIRLHGLGSSCGHGLWRVNDLEGSAAYARIPYARSRHGAKVFPGLRNRTEIRTYNFSHTAVRLANAGICRNCRVNCPVFLGGGPSAVPVQQTTGRDLT